MKLSNNNYIFNNNNQQLKFKGRIEKDINSIERVLRDKYGIEAHLNSSELEPAQELLNSVHSAASLGYELPQRVYTSTGDYLRDRPASKEAVKDSFGLFSPLINAVYCTPRTQDLIEERALRASKVYAARTPSHEIAHASVWNQYGEAGRDFLKSKTLNSYMSERVQQLSDYAAYDGTTPQHLNEFIAETDGAKIDGTFPTDNEYLGHLHQKVYTQLDNIASRNY